MTLGVSMMDWQVKNRRLHLVQHKMWQAQDSYGDNSYFPPYDVTCYKEERITTVKNMAGVEVTSSSRLYFDGILELTGHDLFVIDTIDTPILAFSRFDGLEAGTGTSVVYL